MKEDLIAFKNLKWKEFVGKQSKNPLSSTQFWRRINNLKKNKSSGQASNICTLKKYDKTYTTNEEKANIFKEILKQTFWESPMVNFDNNHKIRVENNVDETFNSNHDCHHD